MDESHASWTIFGETASVKTVTFMSYFSANLNFKQDGPEV